MINMINSMIYKYYIKQTSCIYLFIFMFCLFRSVFHKTIRTNNNVEGWHRRLNSKAGRGKLDLYLLIQLLGEEAALVTIQLDLLRMSVVTSPQRSQRTTGHLFRLWDQLQNEERTPKTVTESCQPPNSCPSRGQV